MEVWKPEKQCILCKKTKDLFDLEICEHSYCELCAKRQIANYIGNKAPFGGFPKCGCGENINYFVCWQIISKCFEDLQVQTLFDEKILENFGKKKENKNSINNNMNDCCGNEYQDVRKNCYVTNDCCEKISNEKEEEFKDINNEALADPNDFVKRFGYKNCPVCGIVIEKIKGCNVITCESQKCQKKTIFCYLCRVTLKHGDNEKHYPNGIFKDCINKT